MGAFAQIRQVFSNLFQWWVIITPWQQGIRVRKGKDITVLTPGMYVRFPFIDVVYMQPNRLRAHAVEVQTIRTKDGKTVVISGHMQYEITDLLQMYSRLHNAHDTLGQLFQGAVFDYVFARRAESLDPEEIRNHLLQVLDFRDYGLIVREVKLNNFAIVKPYRFISGGIDNYTPYYERLETQLTMGEPKQN